METSGPEPTSGIFGADSSSESLPRHTMIGEFEIVGIIGEGGFGTVYLAIDHSLQRKVALKEYRPALLATRHGKSVMLRSTRHADAFEAGLKSFMNEARTLARFDHPSLIHVYRVWQQNNTAYMAMPLCDGKSLTMFIRDNPAVATQEWITSIMMPLLEAVSTLHASNIYHRDIAPDNILIQESGQPMLLDFGAARQIATDKTQALTVILKPGYAPIEQFADDSSMRQGPWTDIYALGAVMYFSLTGKAPPNSVARLAGDPLVSLTSSISEGYSKEFLSAIDAALAVRPQERPQSIAQFRTMLERVPTRTIPRAVAAQPETIPEPSEPPEPPKLPEPPVVPAAERAAWEMSLEPMHEAARPAAAEPPRKASPAVVPATRRTTQALGGAVAGLQRQVKTHYDRLLPVLKTPRGMQVAGATAALLVLVLAVGLVRNPFQPPPAVGTDVAVQTDPAVASAPVASTSPGVFPVDPVPVTTAPAASAAVDGAKPTGAPSIVPPGVTPVPQAPALVSVVEAGPGSGMLTLAVKPWGEVFVNGASKGASPPLKRLTLPEGTYKVEVTNPGFASFSAEVSVTRNKSVTVSHQFK